jgi:hypothetical protein
VSGRIVIITDFLGDVDDLMSSVSRSVVAGKEVHAIHIVAPEEIEPPRDTVLVSDPEDPEVRRPLDADARDTYLKKFSDWRDRIAHDWSDAGVAYSVAIVGSEGADHIVRRVTAPRGMVVSA